MSRYLNYSIEAAANNQIQIQVSNASGASIDLTDYTCNAAMRRHHEAANVQYFETTLYANGLLVLDMNAVTSANLGYGRYVYDVDINHAGTNTTTRVQSGLLSVRPNI